MKHIFIMLLAVMLCGFIANCSPLSPSTNGLGLFRMNLYAMRPDNSSYLVDGTLSQYDSVFSNDIDGLDAMKLFNPGENIGMLRGGYVLIGEKRGIIEGNDSIFFKMWNLRAITYQMVFVASNLEQNGRTGFLEDNYLHSSSPLNLSDTTRINFSVTSDPASKATDRFRVVFVTTHHSPIPLIFSSIDAFERNHLVNINWNTLYEDNINSYHVERAQHDQFFTILTAINANNKAANDYQWTDANPLAGDNYYRISSTDIFGRVDHSKIVQVYVAEGNGTIKIYPNPATASNMNLQFINKLSGRYEITLQNSFGQQVLRKSVDYGGGTTIERLDPPKDLPKGVYRITVTTPSGERKVINVLL